MKKPNPTVFMTGTNTDVDTENLGFDVVFIPVIRTEKMAIDERALQGTYDWIIFTSRNAVKFMKAHLDTIYYTHVASIGSKTSGELMRIGIKPDFEAEVFSQEGFIDKFPARKGVSILYPASKNRRSKLEDYLASRECVVKAVDLYQPVEDRASLEYLITNLNQADAITFASPSAVKAVMEHPSMTAETQALLKEKLIVSIGPVTRDALTKYQIQSISPATYTNEAMIELLSRNFEV